MVDFYLASPPSTSRAKKEEYHLGEDTLASLLFNLNKTLLPFSSLSSSTMARRQAKNVRKYPCTLKQCDEWFTRRSDVKRHAKIHLLGELLEEEMHPCPITETGCNKSMLQLSNLKSHVRAKHPDVKHLVCFDCRPEFRRFYDIAALADHVQLEHPPIRKRTIHSPPKPRCKVVKSSQDIVSPLPPTPSNKALADHVQVEPPSTQKQIHQTKRHRKISKRPLSPPSPPIVSPSDDDSDVFPQPPTGRFPLPPSAPPPVELPDFITIPPSAFPKDEPEPPRPQWYRAKVQGSQPEVQPDPEVPARRCYLATGSQSTVHKKAWDARVIERARQLPSPAPSSSSAGESSESSLGRFPLPPPPPHTSRLITPAFTFNRLQSPSSSRASSPTFEISYYLSREARKGSPRLSNLKSHVRAKHPDVKHLVCFDCRPEFRRFYDIAALADHVQLEHPPIRKRTIHSPPKPRCKVVKSSQDIVSPLPPTPSNKALADHVQVEPPSTQKQIHQTKRHRKISKRPLSPPSPPIVSPSDDDSDVFPQPPTGRFPLPPSAPPPVELPDFITIPPSAFPKDEPEPPRPQWYRAKVQGSQPEVQPDPEVPARRCYLATGSQSTVHKKAWDARVIERARQLPSPAPSSSSAGESSESSLGRFPLPPPPPHTSRLITPAFTFNRLQSPSSSRASSPTFEISYYLSREARKGSPRKFNPDAYCRDTWTTGKSAADP
ncbi:hypothetical protein ARMSODRAFT_1044118 [Armillaria solidipes]|uniref:C2H2-type domain-containing protein n=1 Tax=Armillaria solidipes TaxID=1076256 RepID=A0A2H3BAU1_9AGAR|nr:hypothetical protein ARMSODRAFT_1044118 [Armillaria solidipes]